MFGTLGGAARTTLGRLNANGSLDTTFNPSTDGIVLVMALQPDGKIVVGGAFSTLNGIGRNRLGRLNADGSLDAFDPGADGNVNTIALQADGKVLVGGDFLMLGGRPTRNGSGRLHTNGSIDVDFNVPADGKVQSIVVQPDGKILVGGAFVFLGPVRRDRIARLSQNGSHDFPSFSPFTPNAAVEKIAVQPDGKIIAMGGFTAMDSNNGNHIRHRIARLNADGRVEIDFNPRTSTGNGTTPGGPVFALAVQPDEKIVVGGGPFTILGNSFINNIGRLLADGPSEYSTFTGADNIVSSAAVHPDGKFVVGGFFAALNGVARSWVGRIISGFDLSLDAAFNPGANAAVAALAIQPDGKIVAAGGFVTLGGATRWRVGRLDAAGVIDASFADPGANGLVNTMALQPDGRILVGGAFTTLGGPTRNRIGRLEANGSLDTTFNPGADNSVTAIALQADGKILVGGTFTMLAGAARAGIGRLNPDGSIDDTFNPGATGAGANVPVQAFAVQTDGTILVGGAFTTLGGATRNRIGRLLASGAIDQSFNPGVFGQLNAFAVQSDGKVLVGGPFTGLGGGTGTTTRWNIGRLTNTTLASQSIVTSPGGSVITWLRSGSSPEVSRVTFEISTNDTSYTPLGAGTRIAGGWRLSGQAPPVKQNVFIRARGYYATGYRNGSESIVESVRNVFLAHTAFTDDELTAGLNVIKAVHIMELRTRIDAVRVREGLPAYAYTNAIVAGSSVVATLDVTELRAALAQVYTGLGMTPPSYATSPAQGVTVRAADIASLRAATGAIE